jgi:hypothetical protein
VAEGISTSEIRLSWTDNSTNEDSFHVERQDQGGAFTEVASVPANVTTFTDSGLSAVSFHLYRVRARNSAGNSPYTAVATAVTEDTPSSCVVSATTLCVNGGRFAVRVRWRTATAGGDAQGLSVPSAPDSGLFYFFAAANLELLVKVLNACTLNDRYWVFFAATTNVEMIVTVTDTATGRTWAYLNPLDRPAPPVQDTDAFDTCP